MAKVARSAPSGVHPARSRRQQQRDEWGAGPRPAPGSHAPHGADNSEGQRRGSSIAKNARLRRVSAFAGPGPTL